MTQAAAELPLADRSSGPTRSIRGTLATAVVLTASLAILGIGAWLEPDASGHGTHTQLGMAPCTFLLMTRLPCAACGMTTAVTHAAHGNLVDAFITQPAGALFAIAMAATALVCAYSLVRGVRIAPLALGLTRPKPLIVAVAIVLAAWLYKVITMVGHH